MTTYKGFELFKDIADRVLRIRNQAVVLANLAEDHSKSRLISPKGAGLILGYFNQIDKEDRGDVKEQFAEFMKQRGFKIV